MRQRSRRRRDLPKSSAARTQTIQVALNMEGVPRVDRALVAVIEDGVPKPVISGGEQDIANLCLRLAISQMIAERAGQSFSLLILDEIFGSLDESRRHWRIDRMLLQDLRFPRRFRARQRQEFLRLENSP